VTESLIIQYLGFQAKPLTRAYTFHVRGDGAEREYTIDIANEAFVSHRASYQDAPGICSARLQAELTAHANNPPESQYVITSDELETYRAARAPKSPPSIYNRKPKEDY